MKKSIDERIEKRIAIRYTVGQEISLNRKPDDHPEKIAYLAYVEECKLRYKGGGS